MVNKSRFANMCKEEVMIEINKMPLMFIYTKKYIDTKGKQRTQIIRYEDKKILADWQSKDFVKRYCNFNKKYRLMGINPVMKLTV